MNTENNNQESQEKPKEPNSAGEQEETQKPGRPDELQTPDTQQAPQPSIPAAPSPQTAPNLQAPRPSTSSAESIISKPITRQIDGTDSIDRRSFIKWLTLGWAAFAAIMAGYGALMMRFLFPNVLFEPKQSFNAGYPDAFTVGSVSEKFKESHGVWIVRDPEKIYALSTTCTHLGCTPNWLSNESKFKCPCHGSGFYKTGINFEGPAPRPLERYKISLSDDGEIVVDKTKKFQQEKGEWTDPESFISV